MPVMAWYVPGLKGENRYWFLTNSRSSGDKSFHCLPGGIKASKAL